jgi:glycosyltransferase involved in cell wall biosynthesis
MKKTQPFFSVIISAYNRPKKLVRAIDSVLAQTENNWELIISDDSGNLELSQKITQILKENKNIIYFNHDHVGSAISKNLGIEKAKGKYVTFLDDDDEYSSDHLAFRKEILKKNPGIDFLYGGVKIIGEEFVPDKFRPGKLIHVNEVALGGTFVVKQELFKKVGYFPNEAYGNDSVFFQTVIKSKAKILKVSFPSYIYHRHKDSITMRYKNKNVESKKKKRMKL